MSHKVFISFSSKDKKFAEKIYDKLESHSVSSWISSRDIPPGADYQSCIVNAISDAELVLLVFSSNANASNEIAKELSLSSKKIVVPVRIEDVLPKDSFAYQLSNRQFIDLFDDFESNMDALAINIKNILDGKTLGVASKQEIQKIKLKQKQKKIFKLLGATLAGVALIGVGIWYFINHKAISPDNSATSIPQLSVANEIKPESSSSSKQNDISKQESTKISSEDNQKIDSLIKLLGDASNNDRLNQIDAIYDQLPKNIPAESISRLLKNTNGVRSNAIDTLAKKIQKNLGGQDIKLILGDITNASRMQSITTLADAGVVKQGLSAAEVNLIFDGIKEARSNSIDTLAKKIQKNLGGQDIKLILGDITNASRMQSITTLADAGVVKQGLSAAEVNLIFDGIKEARSNSIDTLAKKIQKNLGGEDLNLILGDTTDATRRSCISELADAGVIKKGLNAREIELILQGIGNSKSQALEILSKFM